MMTSVWIIYVLLTAIISTSTAWPNVDLSDYIPDFHILPLDPFKNHSISVACDDALALLFSDQPSHEAALALDASGKPTPGFLISNLIWLGHWPECKRLDNFRYCTTILKLNMSSIPELVMTSSGLMTWGLCLPRECGDTDVAASIPEIIDLLGYAELKSFDPEVKETQCSTPPPFNAGFYITVILCCVVALLIIAGTSYDVHLKQKKKEEAGENSETLLLKQRHGSIRNEDPSCDQEQHQEARDPGCWERFLLCFSFTRNLAQILNTETKAGSLPHLNGIRVISMTWIILGHLVQKEKLFAWDGVHAFDSYTSFPFQAIVNFAYPSVNSFFLLGGLLVAYVSLGRMARSDGQLPWATFYFHRYWRLLPGLGAAILFTLYLRPYFGEGPYWDHSTSHYTHGCERYWWTNLLYINNFYPIAMETGCMDWTWYLANDMQFYLLSPIFLIALFRKPVMGVIIISAICVASTAVTLTIMFVNDFSAPMLDSTQKQLFEEGAFRALSMVYTKPYCRITPYLVGMVLGYLFHSWRDEVIRINKSVVILGWATAAAIGLAVVYGLYGDFNRGLLLSTTTSAIYVACVHFAWAIALSWVIFACQYGYGGWINDFLSWKVWIPLGRLTYGAYLFHPLIINIFIGNTAHAFQMNAAMISYNFTASCVLSYLVSLLVSLGFELPMANLESIIK